MTGPAAVSNVPSPGSVAATSTATVLIADFASTDAGGKLNVVGGGIAVTTAMPMPGLPQLVIPPQCVVVLITVTPEHTNERFAVTLTLEDENARPLTVPDPAGGPGQPLRLQQLVSAPPVTVPGVPVNKLPGQIQVIINLGQGIPVPPGQMWTWVLEIDGNRKPEWRRSFYVLHGPTPPVLG